MKVNVNKLHIYVLYMILNEVLFFNKKIGIECVCKLKSKRYYVLLMKHFTLVIFLCVLMIGIY